MADKLLTIEFDTTARVEQTLQIIVSGLTTEELFEGIDEGRFITTLDHDGIETIGPVVINSETGQPIARVIRQRELSGHIYNLADTGATEEELGEDLDTVSELIKHLEEQLPETDKLDDLTTYIDNG